MKSPDYWKQISEAASGIALQNVNASKIAKIRVPVAPVEEQQRIVDAIEEHLTRIDATGVWLSSAAKRASALEKAIITEASATLSPPEHWQVVTVGEAGDVSLGLQRSPKRHSGPSMRPYLRVANVYEDRIDGSDVMSMDMSDAEWTRFKLHDGDVLLNEGQSPQFLGRPAIYRGEPPDVAFTNSLIRFRPHNDIDPEWALLVFRSHLHNRRFMRESQITTNIAHLAAGRFKTIEFPIPPREEQAERIGRTRRALDACKRLEGDIAVGRRREKLLTASVLARAFSGKLVAQDPDDEPASSLLDRIRRDRSTSSEQRLPRKKAMA
jgi:type I restriction enzyme S subunit